MKKAAVFSLISVFLFVLYGCSTEQKKCEYCESADVEYKAVFAGEATEYLCEDCYYDAIKNPAFKQFWNVEKI